MWMADPHVISALREKRALVTGLIEKLERKLEQHRADLTHVDGVLRLFQPDCDPDEIKPKRASVSKQELQMAGQLIESFSSDFRPDEYEDTYRDQLCAIIEAKRKGEKIHRVREPEEEETPDLLEALRLSLQQSRGGRARRSGSSRNGNGTSRMTKDELQKRAAKLGIEGRSKMSKDELAEAVASAE